MRRIWSFFWRGLAMGSADVVPGVSGGTIALLTGIYNRLIAAITRFDRRAIQMLWRGQWRELYRHLDASFLLPLLLGIATAVLLLAQLIRAALIHWPLPLWSFFFSLVAVSCGYLSATFTREQVGRVLLWGGSGVLIMVALTITSVPSWPATPWGFFFAGMLAIVAMILPGISGSFMLVLIGLYADVIEALAAFDWQIVAVFGLGAAVGLLGFSRLLSRLLDQYPVPLLALLTGAIAGSLPALWPWRISAPKSLVPVSPSEYAQLVGDPQLAACGIAAACGLLVAILLGQARATMSSEPSSCGG
jgi:putative membrane protein